MLTIRNKTELKLGLYAFIFLCLAFSPLLFNFIWGNHDWIPILQGNKLSAGIIEGRFSQFLLQKLLFSGNILPILSTLFGFILYATALTLLNARYFSFPTQKYTYFAVFAAAILPYMCEILYFHFIIFSQLSWTLVITFSLLATKEATISKHHIFYTFLSFILLFIAIGGYPACINLYVTAAALWLINQKDLSFSRLIKLSLPYIISLLFAFFWLYFTLDWLKHHNYMVTMYNNTTGSALYYLQKIIPTIQMFVKSLIQPQPFLSISLKVTLATLILISLCYFIFIPQVATQKVLTLILIIILPLCIKFSAWMSSQAPTEYFSINDPAFFMVRTDFYSIPCLVLFCLNILFSHNKIYIKNIATAISMALIFISLKTDINYGKVNILGFHAEGLLQERVINRLEQSPNYHPKNYYKIVQAGEISLRPKYYQPSSLEKYGLYTLISPFSRHWLPNENYNFYAPQEFVLTGRSITDDITAQMLDYLINGIKAWPSPKATYVDDRYYIIPLTEDGKKMISDQFNQLRRTSR